MLCVLETNVLLFSISECVSISSFIQRPRDKNQHKTLLCIWKMFFSSLFCPFWRNSSTFSFRPDFIIIYVDLPFCYSIFPALLLSLFAMCMYASYNILYVYKCECAWTFFFCLTFIMLTFYPLEVFFFRFVLVCTKNSGVDRNRTSNDNNIKKRWRKSKDKSTKQQAACTTQCCIRILKEQQQECFQFQVKLVIAQPTTKEIRGMQRMLFGKSRN